MAVFLQVEATLGEAVVFASTRWLRRHGFSSLVVCVCLCVSRGVCVPRGRLLAGLAVDADGGSWDIEGGFRGWLQALVTALVLGSGLCGSAAAGKATKAPTLAKMSTLGANGRLVQPVWTGGDDLVGSSEVWRPSCL
jgi:hypothetical protein